MSSYSNVSKNRYNFGFSNSQVINNNSKYTENLKSK